eukprot:11495648-Karenia_brevis.AAC.1
MKGAGGLVLNGCFGVEKPNSDPVDIGDGMMGPVLRVLMNDQPTSATRRCIEGDISILPTAGLWQNMALVESESFLSSAADR